jgi:hypothetical protein
VSGSAETIPALQDRYDSFLNKALDELFGVLIDSSSEESTTASPRTVPHNATNGCQQPALSIGSKILIDVLWIAIRHFTLGWTEWDLSGLYPDVGGPFPSLHVADVAIIYFIDELRHGAK